MPAPHLHSVDLWVSDLAAALGFYRLLGLDLPEPDGAPFSALTHDGLTFMLGTDDAVRAYDTEREARSGTRVLLEIGYDAPGEVDATFAAAVAAGHRGHLKPFDAFWGVRFAVVDDPDGHPIGLSAPR
jgi:uncharacterized glyoxalase superfamily protein PhnB